MPDSTHADAAIQFESAERRVEERSGVLKKELGLGSLVLTQILYIVGLTWVGVAGKLSLVGAGQQEAFQLLFNSNGILYGLTYLVMFAIPVVGLRGVEPRPPLWLRLAAVSGFLMTLLFVVLSVFPIIEVQNRAAFTFKVTAVIILSNALGAALYLLGRRRARAGASR